MSQEKSSKKALVIGSSGVIGGAFLKTFCDDPTFSAVHDISRSKKNGFDLEDIGSIESEAKQMANNAPFHIIVDATGVLSFEGKGPEKSLASIDSFHLHRTFQINSIGPLFLLKNFAPMLEKGRCIYAKLSARVGSISDNKKGGWYGYRASKAALNMFLQTASIELQRKNSQSIVVALQPGTINSDLSKPFASFVDHFLEPHVSVKGMLNSIYKLSPKNGAYFLDYKGKEILW